MKNKEDFVFTPSATGVQNETATLKLAEISGTELIRGKEQPLLSRATALALDQNLTLDLTNVSRVDAAGISVLTQLYSTAKGAGHKLTLRNANPQLAALLRLVGLEHFLRPEVHPAVSDARVSRKGLDQKLSTPIM